MTIPSKEDQEHLDLLSATDYTGYQKWYTAKTGIPIPDDDTYRTLHTERYKNKDIDIELRLVSRNLLGLEAIKNPITIEEVCSKSGLIQTEKIKVEGQSNPLIILCPGNLTVSQSLKDYFHIWRRRNPKTQMIGYVNMYSAISVKLSNPNTQIYITSLKERKETFNKLDTFFWFYSGY